jgi:hypothetical protein
MLDDSFKRLMCLGCGFSYDEALGLRSNDKPCEHRRQRGPFQGGSPLRAWSKTYFAAKARARAAAGYPADVGGLWLDQAS